MAICSSSAFSIVFQAFLRCYCRSWGIARGWFKQLLCHKYLCEALPWDRAHQLAFNWPGEDRPQRLLLLLVCHWARSVPVAWSRELVEPRSRCLLTASSWFEPLPSCCCCTRLPRLPARFGTLAERQHARGMPRWMRSASFLGLLHLAGIQLQCPWYVCSGLHFSRLDTDFRNRFGHHLAVVSYNLEHIWVLCHWVPSPYICGRHRAPWFLLSYYISSIDSVWHGDSDGSCTWRGDG